ncbi:MAG TPA: DNA gyrase/topoisomerase IV subunit A [Flavobacteriales bacterium]|nr:DNA gyrase/topoisomerase IV subunit A [Flavobacteriales bacterium]
MSEVEGGDLHEDEGPLQSVPEDSNLDQVIQISGMYQDWFLDYASYVILERAVPHLHDGLKPVQRRILHSLKELDDGRYNKVANVIGNTMKYHPHGDASIGDAIVQLGQKDLLLDTQGNWGNIYTGDGSAAPRYIEVRLSKFALDIMFNPKTTVWSSSYDGRGKEPVTLPAKFPLLLAQGVEGIAVGMACKILPHNFNELIDASIQSLKGKNVNIFPDFLTGGMADFTSYNGGLRGGRIRVRARIEKLDKKTLVIREIPFGTTTTSLIESIVRANDKNKIKVKKVEDNTAEEVEVRIYLPSDVSPDKMIDALYAFTDCEVSISPNAAVIENDKPRFIDVNEMLRISTRRTLELLEWELKIKQGELEEMWHFASLEKIFIENRIYRDIEECETWEAILEAIHKGLKPHIKHLLRAVTDEDVTRLTEIRIKRISKFDSMKAEEKIASLENEIEEVKNNIATITDYTIAYFKELKRKYGKGRERKTEIKIFDTIEAAKVAVANARLQMNKEEGFIGIGLKRNESEFVCDCSDIDDIIVFRKDGKMMVTKVSQKAYVGKDIIHANVWKKGDERTVYNMIYTDGKNGAAMMKRFSVNSITRDKEYDLTKGKDGSNVLYFTANPNGEAEVVSIILRAKPKLKKLKLDLDFSELAIKGRAAGGNILTKHTINKIVQKEQGVSTLGARKIWFDDAVQRLNTDERGTYLGAFKGEDKILTIMQSGHYMLSSFDLSTRFDDDMILIQKWDPQTIVSVIYFEGEKENFYVKRFEIEPTENKTLFISEKEGSYLERVTTNSKPVVTLQFTKPKNKDARKAETIDLNEFIAVKGLKAMGNRLSPHHIKSIELEETEEEGADKDEAIEAEENDGFDAPEENVKRTPKIPEEKTDDPGEEKNQMTLF